MMTDNTTNLIGCKDSQLKSSWKVTGQIINSFKAVNDGALNSVHRLSRNSGSSQRAEIMICVKTCWKVDAGLAHPAKTRHDSIS